MTPKEKAQELFNKFFRNIIGYGPRERETAKQCALIAVDEIINSNPTYELSDPFLGNRIYENVNYWKDVKKEIENL
jgi:hypothetical protein